MKRAEAIAWLEIMKEDAIFEQHDALKMAIKALQGDMYCPTCGVRLVPENEYLEPTQTHRRLIDADALEKELSKRWGISDDQDFCNKEVWDALRNAPTVQADRPHGVWEYTEITTDNDTYSEWVCSECGGSGYELMDFCPWCGADMRKGKE